MSVPGADVSLIECSQRDVQFQIMPDVLTVACQGINEIVTSSGEVNPDNAVDNNSDTDNSRMVEDDGTAEVQPSRSPIAFNEEVPSGPGQQRQYQELAARAENVLDQTEEYPLPDIDPVKTKESVDRLLESMRTSMESLALIASNHSRLEENFLTVYRAFDTQRQGVRAFRDMCVESDERIKQDFDCYVGPLQEELVQAKADLALKNREIKRLKASLKKKEAEICVLKNKAKVSATSSRASRTFERPNFNAPSISLLQTPRSDRFT